MCHSWRFSFGLIFFVIACVPIRDFSVRMLSSVGAMTDNAGEDVER